MFIQTDVFIILLKLIYFSIVIIWSRFKLIKVLVSLDYCQNNNNKVRLYLLSYFLYAFPPPPPPTLKMTILNEYFLTGPPIIWLHSW